MVIFLYNLYISGSIFELCCIQNCVITNRVIKRLMCIMQTSFRNPFIGSQDIVQARKCHADAMNNMSSLVVDINMSSPLRGEGVGGGP